MSSESFISRNKQKSKPFSFPQQPDYSRLCDLMKQKSGSLVIIQRLSSELFTKRQIREALSNSKCLLETMNDNETKACMNIQFECFVD